MSFYRSEICNSHIFKKHTRNDQLFDTALRPADLLDQRIPDLRDLLKRRCHAFLQPGIKICCPDLCQISGHSSDIFRDRHMIVIQHNNKITVQLGRIIKRLKRHSTRHRTVTDHGNHTIVFSFQVSRSYIAKTC